MEKKEIKDFSIFFNDEEEFNNFLGQTSYYTTMQNQISKLVETYKPNYVLEFGSGLGKTSFRIAKENPQLSFVAVDNREKLVEYCTDKKEYKTAQNLTFVNGDLTKLNTFNFINVDLVLMVYSFNYISDPIETKIDFLKSIYTKMKKGARLVIGEWFLNDTLTFNENNVKQLYKLRVSEGAQSLFWNNIEVGKTQEEIEDAQKKFNAYKKHHRSLLKNIIERNGIYPVSFKWLKENAELIGFTVELSNYINNINDAVIVLTK